MYKSTTESHSRANGGSLNRTACLVSIGLPGVSSMSAVNTSVQTTGSFTLDAYVAVCRGVATHPVWTNLKASR